MSDGAAGTWFGKRIPTYPQKLLYFCATISGVFAVNLYCRGNIYGIVEPGKRVYVPLANPRDLRAKNCGGFVE